MAIVLATRNPHKLREFGRLLPEVALEALPDEVELPPETGETFAENALVKARTVSAATGVPALADDSGIEAEALGGAPGIYSARYAGANASDAENRDRLRSEVPAGSRLRYVCAVAYVAPGEEPRVAEGSCEGRMAEAPRGEGGFGYDPLFVLAEGDGSRTMAELTDAEKDRISHRGRAAREAAAWLAGG